MNTNERDTHFQGFANLILEEMSDDIVNLVATNGEVDNLVNMGHIIAQRAYDLVHASCQFLGNWEMMQGYDHSYDWEALFEKIPDLTEWPTE